jgi:acetyltransferase-like isoleucine patch superfamily enzyme
MPVVNERSALRTRRVQPHVATAPPSARSAWARLKKPLRDWVALGIRKCVADAPYIVGDPNRVHLGVHTSIMDAVLNVRSGTITIEDFAFLGHGVMLLTGSHDPRLTLRDRFYTVPTTGNDIVIESGAWIASGAMVLGPCRIGANALVAAGAVVHKDVAPGQIVGGVPAEPIGQIPSAFSAR